MFLVCSFQSISFASESPKHIRVNSEIIEFTQKEKPVIRNNRTYVPLRLISENLGADVHWFENQVFISKSKKLDLTNLPTNKSNKIKILIDDEVIDIKSSEGQAYINENNKTMIPLRVIAEKLNCDVLFDRGEVTLLTHKKDNPKEDTKDESIDGFIGDLIENKPNNTIPNDNIVDSTPKEEPKEESKIEKITIKGPAIATSAQLKQMAEREAARLKKARGSGFIPFPDVIDLYLEIGEEYGIRGDLAYAQALKETGYFQFGNEVQPYQNNYCGLWATGSVLTGNEVKALADRKIIYDTEKAKFETGLHGLTFSKPEYGVEAHIQHLYAYTTKGDLPPGKKLINPRFHYVNRGIATYWQDLDGRWAVPGVGYGDSIIDGYWKKHKN